MFPQAAHKVTVATAAAAVVVVGQVPMAHVVPAVLPQVVVAKP